jgi:hypothetical protein
VNHSNNAIVKPQAKSQEAAQREIEEAMKKVKEAQSLITAAIDPGQGRIYAIHIYTEYKLITCHGNSCVMTWALLINLFCSCNGTDQNSLKCSNVQIF